MIRISESSQTYPNWYIPQTHLQYPSPYDLKRKDSLKIKSRLLKLVNDPNYWIILSQFLKGECSKQTYDEAMDVFLQTNEARLLHNDFIRSILFNAHFSPTPPPGIPMPQKKLPEHLTLNLNKKHHRIKRRMFSSYSSADLGHIPSIEQLSSRVAQLTSIKVENSAISLLFDELTHYILMVLKMCKDSIPQFADKSEIIISASQIMNVLSAYKELDFKNRSKLFTGALYKE